ncbi:glycoside hydrolase family 3 protein [Spiractinospora alimapuensis]|uniref:beta-glucosidase family protein n=1 Tax=Spiractinospora alimapuensis TaxID=2820884 RepID=UPI001F42DE8C|nr:glycoside hydrolase family 3 protein [Spiractinospora alimapuensis]QVQ51476.1 glycoside hydrolase family 3 protein [Spiractinospora alimapuensis]
MAEQPATPAEAGREQCVTEALAKLDLPAKIALLSGATTWSLPAEPEIGLRPLVMSDGPAGVRGERWAPEDTAVQLPNASALAATWDPELVRTAGRLLAQEARRKGVHLLLAPTINLHRTPRAGRHFECYSEDPLLTAEIGIGLVRGVQDGGVGATIKHFVANDSETDRFTVDVQIDHRTLREIYLAPFEAIIRYASPWAVMSAYNAVNGTTMTENAALNAVLREEWGFSGVIVSDWHAARDTVRDALAGMDVAMPGPDTVYGDKLLAAVKEGVVPEPQIDRMATRVLRLAARTGALEGASVEAPYDGVVDGHALSNELAARSMVLLRNHVEPGGGPTLPLNPKGLRRVAVLGAAAAHPRTGGGGSARVFPPYRISPLQGLRDALPPGVEVSYAEGSNPRLSLPVIEGAVRAELYDDDGSLLSGADLSQASTNGLPELLGDVEVEDVRAVELSGTVDVAEPGRHVFEVRGQGRLTLIVNGKERFSGTLTLADPENPGAALLAPARKRVEMHLEPGTVSFALVKTDIDPANLEFALFSLAYSEPLPDPQRQLDEAEDLAKNADVAIVVVGTSEDVESEGFDRESLALPGTQDELVRRVASVNPRTIVVLNCGAPVLTPWREDVSGILLGWFGGQEMGAAVADVLLGVREPTGRLPTTWPDREDDAPVLATRPNYGELVYEEGVFVGYRAWERAGRTPAYCFGHGLGYTEWRYDSVAAGPGLDDTELARVRVRITNVGTRPGRDVVQVYLSAPDRADGPDRPRFWLAGFASVTAEPGDVAQADIVLPRRAAEVWTDEGWRLPPGSYQILAGASYRDIRLAAALPIT